MRRAGLVLILFGILPHSLVAAQNPAGAEQVYLVLLREPSVIEKVLEWSSGSSPSHRRQVLRSPEAQRYQHQIEDQQLGVMELLDRQPNPAVDQQLEVLDRRTYLLNMLVVRASGDQMGGLESDDRVKSVHPNRVYYPALDSAPYLLGASSLWEALGGVAQAGLGMKIGIIDSGINVDHPMFGGNGLVAPAGFPLGEIDFTTQKIIVARNYVLPEFGLRVQSVKTPEDELGHGSRVAGVAAGGIVETSIGVIQGFAPASFLGNYKVFGSPSVNPTTSSAAIIAAIEDGVQDGMDVLNLSLGGQAKSAADDPEQQAIRLAVEAGVVVVVAAGNAGPDPGTVTSPGTSPAAITVGATSNGRIFASGLSITSEVAVPSEIRNLPYVAGTGEPIAEAVGPLPLVSVISRDPSELACASFPEGTFTEQVVLVRRGDCLFSIKATHLFQAGAAGMLVYNNIGGSAVVMSGLDGIPQPAVMIEKEQGEVLRDFLQIAVAQISFGPVSEEIPFPTRPHLMAEFSGRGPTGELGIKPDLVAPGENIHTATNEAEGGSPFTRRANGTSFATPMVAAAAALIKQLHPEWADQLSAPDLARTIKSVLVNTASKQALWRERPAGVMHSGNGSLDLMQAIQSQAALHPVSLSFGHSSEDVSGRLQQRVQLTNLDERPRTFEIEAVAQVENPTVEVFTSPRELSLSPGETGEFLVNVDLLAPLTGGIFEGFVQVSGVSGTTELTAAYWGAVTVEDSSVALRVSQGDVSAHPTLASAVEAAQPGNVIRIEDEGVYQEALNIRYNQDGLLLNGLKITGAAGGYPTLDARNVTGTSAALTIFDLERVTVEGLRIRGGRHGIVYQNSSGVIRENIIDGTSGSQGSHGIELSNSRVHLYGNRIHGSQGRALALFGSDALIQQNQLGGQQPGEENRGGGIYAPGGGRLGIYSNHLDRSGGSGFSDAGIHLSNLEAVIKGNTVEQGRGGSADGVVVRGQRSMVALLDNEIRDNGGNGVVVEDGAEALFQRNLIQGNEGAGIRVEGDSRAEVRSSRLLENQRGIRSLSSRLILSDTLVAGSLHPEEGDGVWAAGGELQVSNSTIFGNLGLGLSSSAVEASVANSIIQANNGGDLEGIPQESIHTSLISDGPAEGVNGNLSGDALFVNPDSEDFSLRPDSPAIDQGNQEDALSPVDLRSHQRVVDGDGDGIDRVDMGALEFGSQYWTPRFLTAVAAQQNLFQGLGLVNASVRVARVLIKGYTTDGRLATTFELPLLEAGEQRNLLLGEIPDLPRLGWLEILSTESDLMGVSFLGDFRLNFLGGVELCCALSDRLVFSEVSGAAGQETSLFLVNPGTTGLEVALAWNRNGEPLQQTTRFLPPKGMLAATVRELFGGGSGGYIMAFVASGEVISGMETVGSGDSRAAILALDYRGGGAELVAPHFSSTPGVQTFLKLIATEPATLVRMEALDSEGETIDVVELETLLAGEELVASVRELFVLPVGPVTGWVKVSAQQGALLGDVRYSKAGGEPQAIFPLLTEGARELVFGHARDDDQIFSALALLNPLSVQALVSVEVLDGNGQPGGVSLLSLGGGQRAVGLLSDLIPEPIPATGWIRIRSNSPVFGLEVVGGDGFLAAVSQQVTIP